MTLLFADKRPSEIPIVVLDTETTGLDPALGHRLVEIGAVRLENWQKTAEISQLIQPERAMDPGATAVNGITNAALVGQPLFRDVAAGLLTFMDGALLVAHNAAFDAAFLGLEFYLAGYAPAEGGPRPVLPHPWLCTLQLARHHFYFGKNNLGAIAQRLGVRAGRSHRALNDVYTTVEVLKRMSYELEKKHRLTTVGDLLHAQGGPIYTPPTPQTAVPPLLQAAIANGYSLLITYVSEQSGHTQRRISPKYITEARGVAYLIAYCHRSQAQRTFRLDRILSIEAGE